DLRAIARKTCASQGSRQLSHLPLGKINLPPGAQLSQPNIERAVVIGNKGCKPAVRRDRGFGALEVRHAREVSSLKRIERRSWRASYFPAGGRDQEKASDAPRQPRAAWLCLGRNRPIRRAQLCKPPQIYDQLAHRLVTIARVFLQCFFDYQPQRCRNVFA